MSETITVCGVTFQVIQPADDLRYGLDAYAGPDDIKDRVVWLSPKVTSETRVQVLADVTRQLYEALAEAPV